MATRARFLKPFVAAGLAFAAQAAPLPVGSAEAQTLLRDAEIEDWIKDYSYPIFEAANLDPDSIEFLLLAGPPNAFASGRTMGIFTGLITLADTPNQIEGVIAHEAGHMAGNHGIRRNEAYAKASRPMLLSLVLAAGAIAAGAPEAGFGLLGLGQQIATVNALTYTRYQESTADQAAVTYLDEVGHSGAGLVEFFGKLRNNQVITGYQINPYLQTHPLASARMSALENRVTTSPHYEAQNTQAEIDRLQLIQAKIKGFLDEPKFTFREYPVTDKSAPARYARAVAYYRSANIKSGLKEIDSLLAESPDNPYFHELKGQMLFEFGRVAESVSPHRKSVEMEPTTALLRINLGRALLASGESASVEEAITILQSALQLEPDNGFGWSELSRAYGFFQREGEALLATAEARYHWGNKPEAVQFARRALPHFKRGSADWQQAQDIIVASAGNGKRRQRPDGPGRRPDTPEPSPEPDEAPQTDPSPDEVPDEIPPPR